MILLDDQVRLEPITKEHMVKTFAWISTPDLRRTFLLQREITWAAHEDYFGRVLTDSSQRLYAILYKGEHVGNCGFKRLDLVAGNGELWIYLGVSEIRGKGIGEKATRLLLREGVEQFGLERVQVHVAESNERARRLYLRMGFIEVGEGGAEWQRRECRILEMCWEKKET